MELKDEQGARAILQQSRLTINRLEFPHGEWDIDPPEDLETLQSNAQTRMQIRRQAR